MFHVEHPVLKENNRPAPQARAVQYQNTNRQEDDGSEEEKGFEKDKENNRSSADEFYERVAPVWMRR